MRTDINRFLVLMLTARCNLSCRYCYADDRASGPDMDLSTACLAIDRFTPAHGRLTVQMSGGEPLLAWELLKQTVLARQDRAIRFAVQTNATLLSREKLFFLLDHGVGLGLSLDSIPCVNDPLRGSTQKVIQALNLLDGLGMGVNITTVLTRASVPHLPEFLMFCASHPCIQFINLDMFRPVGRGWGTNLSPAPGQIESMVPQMIATLDFINSRRRQRLKIRELEQFHQRSASSGDQPYCLAARGDAAAVTPLGDIYPCPSLMGKAGFQSGTVRDRPDTDPFLASPLIAGQDLPAQCRGCAALFYCQGGCPARSYFSTNPTLQTYQPGCALRRAIVSAMETKGPAPTTPPA